MAKSTTADHTQLELLKSVADGITALFFPSVEVVIHDVVADRIVYIANNLSRRSPGDDAGLDELRGEILEPVTGPYEKLNWDGKKMRSVTISARKGTEPSYLLCINLSTSIFEEARNALDLFLSVTRLQPQPEQLFRDDWQEKINTFLHEWIRRQNSSLGMLTRGQKKQLVIELHKEGAFRAKNSADYIASVLSLGRSTIYKYLRELKD
ncbi:helix-turn-helix transcriptional regulator [Klebsiella michiganensis]|uniref:helix-turn-helix transcriptional regulator n=1 Tax=Klebsiella michiganensis TaxID=1134687 RepID=UPI0023A94333|nr:PAS domain-containing protein [Klebsiella michiganensis]MDD9640746.1 PAS domain-containing protein [Klebsiella michiganensis]